MRSKPSQCYDAGCPLAIICICKHNEIDHIEGHQCQKCPCKEFASKGKGFVLGLGDPASARFAFILEAPGKDEIAFELRPLAGRTFLSSSADVQLEMDRRRKFYSGIDEKWLRWGAPIVGATGNVLDWWVWPKVGITRATNEAKGGIFLDNTLRCLLPPSKKGGAAYPIGKERVEAERCCRQYDRLELFHPDCAVVTLHPAGVMRDITPLPLLIRDMEKVRDFTNQGKRVMCLLGGKAAKAFLRYASNVTRWRGHYQGLASDWGSTYKRLFAGKPKKVREKKSTGQQVAGAREPKRQKLAPRVDARVWDDVFGLAGAGKLRKTRRKREKSAGENG